MPYVANNPLSYTDPSGGMYAVPVAPPVDPVSIGIDIAIGLGDLLSAVLGLGGCGPPHTDPHLLMGDQLPSQVQQHYCPNGECDPPPRPQFEHGSLPLPARGRFANKKALRVHGTRSALLNQLR